jgi:hypothetical protein
MMRRRTSPLIRALALGVACSSVGCNPTPSIQPTSTPPPSLIASLAPSPSLGPTSAETISIACFLAVHAVVDDFRHIQAQLDAFPAAEQQEILRRYAASASDGIEGAPPGCFSDEQTAASDALIAYLSATPASDLAADRIQQLMTAMGLALPTLRP